MIDPEVIRQLCAGPMGAMRICITVLREDLGEHALADALTAVRDGWARAASEHLKGRRR